MPSPAKRGLGAAGGSSTDASPTGKRLKAAAAKPMAKVDHKPTPKGKTGRSQGGARSRAAAVADIEDCALPPAEQVAFRAALLGWYDANRRQLPWRGDPPPYGASLTARTEAAAAAATAAAALGSGKKASPGKKATSSLVVGQTSLSRFFSNAPKAAAPTPADAPAAEEVGAPTSSPHFATAAAAASSPLPSASSPPEATAAAATAAPVAALRRPVVSAYGTWVCEVMSQQTRIETVVDYWTKWMALFPTVAALAAATPEEVCDHCHSSGTGNSARLALMHVRVAGAPFFLCACGVCLLSVHVRGRRVCHLTHTYTCACTRARFFFCVSSAGCACPPLPGERGVGGAGVLPPRAQLARGRNQVRGRARR